MRIDVPVDAHFDLALSEDALNRALSAIPGVAAGHPGRAGAVHEFEAPAIAHGRYTVTPAATGCAVRLEATFRVTVDDLRPDAEETVRAGVADAIRRDVAAWLAAIASR